MISELEKLEVAREPWLLPYKDQRLSYDFLTHELTVRGIVVRLPPTPDQILTALLIIPGRAVSYKKFDFFEPPITSTKATDNRLSAQITILRSKLDLPSIYHSESCIQPIYKFGYKYIPLK